jgi:hypothetical protein
LGHATGKRDYRVSKSELTDSSRRSACLQDIVKGTPSIKAKEHHRQPLSSSSTPSHKQSQAQKRKQLHLHDTSTCLDLGGQTPSDRSRVSPVCHEPEQVPEPKQRCASMHRSDLVQQMAENGIHMEGPDRIQNESKDLCQSFLAGDHTPGQDLCYPVERIPEILDHISGLNEARLQKDITPWVVPSAENLFFCGGATVDYIGEEIREDWWNCEAMGSTRPKPDYTAGLLQKAFTEEEFRKLKNYASDAKPFLFTHHLCFPFLICEVKTGEQGLATADRRNAHSASISVRAIIELHKAAFGAKCPGRVSELYGQVLAFTVSHDNEQAKLYGHYATDNGRQDGTLRFCRHHINTYSFTRNNGAERFKAYNFVRNVYDKFVPGHLRRIQYAAASLPVDLCRWNVRPAGQRLAERE